MTDQQVSAQSLLLCLDGELTKPHKAAGAVTPAQGCLQPPRLCTVCGHKPSLCLSCHMEYSSHGLSFNNHIDASVRQDIKIIFSGSKVLLYTLTSMPFPLAPSPCHSPCWSPWQRSCFSKKGSPGSHTSCKPFRVQTGFKDFLIILSSLI